MSMRYVKCYDVTTYMPNTYPTLVQFQCVNAVWQTHNSQQNKIDISSFCNEALHALVRQLYLCMCKLSCC